MCFRAGDNIYLLCPKIPEISCSSTGPKNNFGLWANNYQARPWPPGPVSTPEPGNPKPHHLAATIDTLLLPLILRFQFTTTYYIPESHLPSLIFFLCDVPTALTKRTQDGGTEVVEAKAGKGSATLSMVYAGALFADACLKGLNGVPDVEECSYVQSTITELPFFASKVRLGKNGVEDVLDLGPLSDFEKEGLEALKPKLKSFIEKGVKFANQ
ncbi:hypothetical protein YC2023_076707 [Brassica napus]